MVSHSEPSEDFSVSRIMLSKLTGASFNARYGVLVLFLWKLLIKLLFRGGEFSGLGDDDEDDEAFEEVSLSMYNKLL